MFGGMSILNYESRSLGRYEEDNLFVSTALVTDSDDPYETAIAHPFYNEGTIVIVETYDSKDDA